MSQPSLSELTSSRFFETPFQVEVSSANAR